MSWEDQCGDNFKKLNIAAPVFVPRGVASVEKEENRLSEKDLNHSAEVSEAASSNEVKEEPQTVVIKEALPQPREPLQPRTVTKKVEVAPLIEEIIMPYKEFVNVVFIGHVDAGKSTIGGNILILTGNVDPREVEKNIKKSKEMNRETWYLSWALDLNDDERLKGKTVECGRASFETEHKHYTLLDAPGHKSYLTHMISGSSQADIAILVISARIGEFEAGFEKGGQTQEHAMLVKTSGVKRLVVLINKMDDPSVEWSEARYNEIKEKLTPFLKKTGFNPKTDLHFMPCSGFKGYFLKDPAPESICSFYRGPSLLDYLDCMPPLERNVNGPLRLTVLDKVKDMGLYIIGKIESGSVRKGQTIVMMPNEKSIEVVQIMKDDFEFDIAIAGDNVMLKVKNVEEDEISSGSILCQQDNLCKVTNTFDAQILVGDVKSIITMGYSAIMHVHSLTREVSIKSLLGILDKKNPKICKSKHPQYIRSGDLVMVRFVVNDGTICVENFKDFPQLGRFMLREKTQTVAQGKIMKIFPLN